MSGAFLAEKLGRAVFQLGVVLQAIGAGLLWFAVTAFAEFNVWQLVPGMGLAGLGTGLVIAALFDKILSSVDDELVGSASGVLSAIQSIASSLGVAVFGTIFFDGVAKGQLNEGFTNTLLMDFAFLAGFAALTFFFSQKNEARDH